MKNIFLVVVIGVTSNIFSGVPFLPSASAQCILAADPCSADGGGEECCFAELGAVCDASSNGGSCCFPDIGDEEAVCTQNDDCCGGLLCIGNVCSDIIEFTTEGVELTVAIAETAYGSGEQVVSTITAQQEGGDAFVFTLDADGEVATITSNGETLYPVPAASVRHLQTNHEGAVTTVDPTHLQAIERGTRNLNELAVETCQLLGRLICSIGLGLACLGASGPTLVICGALANEVCRAGAEALEGVCESIVDCEGDPHMRGLQGQKFDFAGKDGAWYAIIHDEAFFVNMRVTAPIPGLVDITYITGLGMSIMDVDGERHTVVMIVDNPLEMQSECPDVRQACLADGALTVELDGVRITEPGEVLLGGGVSFAAVNIPGECRPFGFEKYWQKKADAQATLVDSEGRRLDLAPTGLWILADEHKTNPTECRAYVRTVMEDGTLFEHQSEHTSIQIRGSGLSIRVNHGKIHQLAMRDPTDQFDLPDHTAYQMNIAFERFNIGEYPQGVIGATAHITKDEYGEDILNGPGAIPGEEEDYRVSGPLGTDFVASKLYLRYPEHVHPSGGRHVLPHQDTTTGSRMLP